MTSKHIVLTTWGSLGDLHPMLALALELQQRGHRVTIATSAIYRLKIESTGVGFHAVRPDLWQGGTVQETTRRAMDPQSGTQYVFGTMLMPHLQKSYDDLSEIARDCDLIVTHPTALAGPLVAQKHGLRWASCVLAPLSMFSAYDPPVPPLHPQIAAIYRLGPFARHLIFSLIKRKTRSWFAPIEKLRAQIGLPRGAHPLFGGQVSPQLHLAMFSQALGAPQPDWPRQTVQSGFAFYDLKGALDTDFLNADNSARQHGENDGALSPALSQFLDEGEAPIVFTLGSAAVVNPNDFFRESAQAAVLLNRRAVLLGDVHDIGSKISPHNESSTRSRRQIASFDYAPYSQIFPRACAIVHQGGVGTTAQAMRAGRPQLIIPHSHDQPDNAARIAHRGLGQTLPLQHYKAQRVADELRPLLSDIEYSNRASQIGKQVQSENGVARAADALEALLKT